MKNNHRFLMLVLMLVLMPVAVCSLAPGFASNLARADDEILSDLTRSQMPAIVQDEYGKLERQLQGDLSTSQARLKALQAERDAAVARASDAAKVDEIGIKLLHDFDSLVRVRYVDKKGKFQSGMELGQSDVDNLNGIFLAHMSMTPLIGRVSSGQARRQIAWALDHMDDVLKAHRDPNEGNNSELEIIGKQTRDEEAKSEKTNMLADTLGVKLDPNAMPPSTDSAMLRAITPTAPAMTATTPAPQQRAPASTTQKKRHRKTKTDSEDQ